MHCHELNSTRKKQPSHQFRAIEDCLPWQFRIQKPHFHRWKLCTFVGKECIFPPHQGKKRRRWNLQFSNGKFINGKYVKGIIKHIALYMMRLIRSITSSCYKWWWITNWEPGRNDMMPPSITQWETNTVHHSILLNHSGMWGNPSATAFPVHSFPSKRQEFTRKPNISSAC